MNIKPEIKPVLFSEERVGAYGLGVIQLNRPEALNALTLEMFELIKARLLEWKDQQDIVAVFIHAESDKAFCAGGDVKSLIKTQLQTGNIEHSKRFFEYEYFVDYLVQIYPKPIVCWAHGVAMGGGLGLINGSPFKVVTEKTLMAMPEINIGFFPDVGASYFLSRLENGIGLFLGLTGYRFTGADAVEVGLANYCLPSETKRKVMADLMRLPFTGNARVDWVVVEDYFNETRKNVSSSTFTPTSTQKFSLKEIYRSFQPVISSYLQRCSRQGLDKQGARAQLENEMLEIFSAHPELSETQKRFEQGSPISKAFVMEQIALGESWGLRETFIYEWAAAIHFCENPDFIEGVRAVLIDKDNSPKWKYSSLGEVPDSEITEYFVADKNSQNLLQKSLGRLDI